MAHDPPGKDPLSKPDQPTEQGGKTLSERLLANCTEQKRLTNWVPASPEPPDAVYLDFITKFNAAYSIDLGQYKEKQMRRRINMMLAMYGLETYDGLLALMETDAKVKTRFFDRLTINVSEFFRNPDRWEALEKEVLAPLAAKENELSVFCAGCSTGEEPYTLAILALSKGWNRMKITGWDIDQDALNQAAKGQYHARQLKNVSKENLEKYFTPEGEDWAVKPEVKKLVSFHRHNLLEDPFKGPYHVILCRNVVIYFTEETKDKLYERFVQALKPSGFLFVGSTERVVNAANLGLSYFSPFIYKKTGV